MIYLLSLKPPTFRVTFQASSGSFRKLNKPQVSYKQHILFSNMILLCNQISQLSLSFLLIIIQIRYKLDLNFFKTIRKIANEFNLSLNGQ